jgi:gamma-glutamylcyclotransferase (GGCT)/AIG2-like uncharacterized protein YtfP
MNDLLFAYGTLMLPFDNAIARCLYENSTFCGDATVPGRLYDLGPYPGLIYNRQSAQRVRGQVFRMHDPGDLLRLLDRYEGIDRRFPGAGEYRRERRRVSMNEEAVDCWMYVYNQPWWKLPAIRSGCYADYVMNDTPHIPLIDSV